mgnify:CR=1 FL=1
MIDLNADYNEYLDSQANDITDKLTDAQMLQALEHFVEDINNKETVAHLLVKGDNVGFAIAVRGICYEYWRNMMAEKNRFDTWESEHNADRAADKAEDAYETYEANNGSDK